MRWGETLEEAAGAVLGPPDHVVKLSSEQYGEAIDDYLRKHRLLPPGRFHQAHTSVQEFGGRAALVVHAWRSDDPIETTATLAGQPPLLKGPEEPCWRDSAAQPPVSPSQVARARAQGGSRG